MTTTRNETENSCILRISGRIDTTTARDLQTELSAAISENKKVVLDFAGVDYVSSAGLRVILSGEKQTKVCGCVMSLTNVSKDVMEIFDMTGFSDILKFE